jgi:hypothetical protein
MRQAADALDHVLLGAPTLEEGMAWLEERTGVRAIPGGSHPGLGTWNSLASLGPARYIEIIAPDPAQRSVDTFYVPGLRDFKEPRIATWAARADDLLSRFTSDLPRGFVCETPRRGSRVRPDGTRLAWSLAFPKDVSQGNFDGALPFFIEWEAGSPHPGLSAPSGLRLLSISIAHPTHTALNEAFRALGIGDEVLEEATPSIRVKLDTPRGAVIL